MVVEADASAMGVATVVDPLPPRAQLPPQVLPLHQTSTLVARASLEVVDRGAQANAQISLMHARLVCQIQAEVDALTMVAVTVVAHLPLPRPLRLPQALAPITVACTVVAHKDLAKSIW